MRHAATRMLFSTWDSVRGERAAPERRDLDPGTLRHVLADIFVLEIDPPRTYPFRLAGTRVCGLAGRELRGTSYLDLFPKESRVEAAGLAQAVADDRLGIVAGIGALSAAGAGIDLEMVLLPLRHCGVTHARLIGALSPAAIPAWIGHDPLVALRLRSLRVIRPEACAVAPRPAEESPAARRGRFRLVEGGRGGETRP